MAVNCKTWEDLENELNKAVNIMMTDLGSYLKKEVTNEIQKQVYDSYQPMEYTRSFQLLNSVMFKQMVKNRTTELTIFNDKSLISSSEPNVYTSIVKDYNPHSVSQWADWLVIGGHQGDILGGQGTWNKPHPVYDTVKERMESGVLVSKVREIFKNNGYDVR